MIFFTADTHFNDPRILKIDRRPFHDLAAHDAALVEAWNAAVQPGDTVYHLGDFAKDAVEAKAALLARLNGTKHLIAGNNDDDVTRTLAGWASVTDYAEIEVEGRRLVLCHYAFRTWNGMGKGVLDLHGHSHAKLTPATRQYDVGVDAFPFRPVTLEVILTSRKRGGARKAAT